jgi:hypothetical protein
LAVEACGDWLGNSTALPLAAVSFLCCRGRRCTAVATAFEVAAAVTVAASAGAAIELHLLRKMLLLLFKPLLLKELLLLLQ